MSYAPWMRSVVVGVTPLQLSALIAAIDPNVSTRFTKLYVQYNVGATGVLLIGNNVTGAALSATNCGANVAPGAAPWPIDASDTGVGLTTDVWLLAGAAAQQVNIILFQIGK